jgi:hypothetical protein
MGWVVNLLVMGAVGSAGLVSAQFVHWFSSFIVLRTISTGSSDLMRVGPSPLWKQPLGRLLLLPYLGNVIYLLIILAFTPLALNNISSNRPMVTGLPVIFIIGAIVGVLSNLISSLEQTGSGMGSLFTYRVIKKSIAQGCLCGCRELLYGVETLRCAGCGRIIHRFEQAPVRSVFGTAREFEASIAVDAGRERVYDHLLSPPSRENMKRLGMQNYAPKPDGGASYIIRGVMTHTKLVGARKPSFIHIRYTYGTNTRDEYIELAGWSAGTKVHVRLLLSHDAPRRSVERGLKKNLEFMKSEIESEVLEPG